jgi:hypothetical protein
VGKKESSYTDGNNTTIMENSMEVPQKLKIQLPSDPATPLLGTYPKEYKVRL